MNKNAKLFEIFSNFSLNKEWLGLKEPVWGIISKFGSPRPFPSSLLLLLRTCHVIFCTFDFFNYFSCHLLSFFDRFEGKFLILIEWLREQCKMKYAHRWFLVKFWKISIILLTGRSKKRGIVFGIGLEFLEFY